MALRTGIPLTAEWLTKGFLYGVDLTDDNGRYYPPEMFEIALESAVAWAETELGIKINKTEMVERIDASGSSLMSYPPIKLPDVFINSVSAISWKLGESTTILPWPTDWFVRRGNVIQMIPAATGTQQDIQNYPLYAQALQLMNSGTAALWEITYIAGVETDGVITEFEETKATSAAVWRPSFYVWNELTITLPAIDSVDRTFNVYGYRKEDGKPFDGLSRLKTDYDAETITIVAGSISATTETAWSQVTNVTWTGWTESPAIDITISGWQNDPTGIDIDRDLMSLIGAKASIHMLNTAGDLIIGAGIANKSVSTDGISTSVGTTSSPTNAGYGARIIQLQRQIDKQTPLLWNKYHGIMVAAW